MSAADPHPVGEDDLHGLIDGRLEPERRALVEAWLAQHPEAAGRVAADRETRERLRAALAPVAAEPIPARLRVANLLAARRRSGLPARLRMAAALLLCLGLGAAGGWLARGATPPAPTGGEPLTRDAVAAFRTFVVEAAHPVEVKAGERAHLVQWLSRRLDHPLTVPDLSAQGFRLMGGRLVPTDGAPAALLMYDDAAGTRLTLYGRVGGTAGPTSFRYAQDGDVGAFSWAEGDLAYVVTARVDAARLLAVAEAVDAQVRSQGRPEP